ncbi:MAG: spherulation-specific family 4 protein [Thiothrix sp.]|uniref:spherulation-specific family 4 protein n=1 Tax=Thiothrix sp. TaxID=1032 RepID=UPI00260A44D4|nr:spherulation-specific family 4 protein [Thiothrix sp.]MDD5392540.1 spherulation-specific family 4 protein [Thiothrix sp.]
MAKLRPVLAASLVMLASLGFTASAEAGSCPGIAIPAYFYPGTTWTTSTNSAPRVNVMIMNPNSGPGLSQDPQYVQSVKAAQAAGIKVLGYVASAYGDQTIRPLQMMQSEIDSYKNWYGVDGIFVDEVASSAAFVPQYQQIANYIRSAKGGFVMLNPGVVPAASYVNMADTTVVFEDSYANYLNWVMPTWLSNYPASKITHLVYATSAAQMPNAVKLGAVRNAGELFVTNDKLDNPWDTLPSYWTTELSAILTGCK